MPFPEPTPGLVICYAYLCYEQARRGAEEGRKDRPCVIVLSAVRDELGTVVTVAPITRRPPAAPETAIELPSDTRRRLGLGDEPSWAIVSKVNRFRWPGPDLRPIAGTDPPRFDYGLLPAKLIRRIRARLIDVASRRGAPVVRRTE